MANRFVRRTDRFPSHSVGTIWARSRSSTRSSSRAITRFVMRSFATFEGIAKSIDGEFVARRGDSVRGETSVGAGHSRGTRRAQTRARRRARLASRRQTRRHGANTSRAPNEKRRRQQSRARRTTRRRSPRAMRTPRAAASAAFSAVSALLLEERDGRALVAVLRDADSIAAAKALLTPAFLVNFPRCRRGVRAQPSRKMPEDTNVVLESHRRRFGRLRRQMASAMATTRAGEAKARSSAATAGAHARRLSRNGGAPTAAGGAGGVGAWRRGAREGVVRLRVSRRARADEAHPRGEPIAGLESLFG